MLSSAGHTGSDHAVGGWASLSKRPLHAPHADAAPSARKPGDFNRRLAFMTCKSTGAFRRRLDGFVGALRRQTLGRDLQLLALGCCLPHDRSTSNERLNASLLDRNSLLIDE